MDSWTDPTISLAFKFPDQLIPEIDGLFKIMTGIDMQQGEREFGRPECFPWQGEPARSNPFLRKTAEPAAQTGQQLPALHKLLQTSAP